MQRAMRDDGKRASGGQRIERGDQPRMQPAGIFAPRFAFRAFDRLAERLDCFDQPLGGKDANLNA